MTDGQEIQAGDPIVEGPRDPKELLEIKGVRETQQYLVDEVQKVYRDQGVSIHDKHIELIVRQMTRRVAVQEPGDSDFLPGERVDQKVFADDQPRAGRRRASAGRGPSRAHGHHQGVAGHRLVAVGGVVPGDHPGAHRGRHRVASSDALLGLKENIIIGKLIPAGTGMHALPGASTPRPPTTSRWSSTPRTTEPDLAEWLANIGRRRRRPTATADAEVVDCRRRRASADRTDAAG